MKVAVEMVAADLPLSRVEAALAGQFPRPSPQTLSRSLIAPARTAKNPADTPRPTIPSPPTTKPATLSPEVPAGAGGGFFLPRRSRLGRRFRHGLDLLLEHELDRLRLALLQEKLGAGNPCAQERSR